MSEMSELQREIMKWHGDIFSGRRPAVTAKKLLEEASECHIAFKEGNMVKGAWEAADTAIPCYVLAQMTGHDLEWLIREKLKVLVERGAEQKRRDEERGIEHGDAALVTGLRKRAQCVYLATAEGPADDIANYLRLAADRIEQLSGVPV